MKFLTIFRIPSVAVGYTAETKQTPMIKIKLGMVIPRFRVLLILFIAVKFIL